MGTLIKTGALIQNNFWVCLVLVSLSLTIVGAGRVTIELRQRQNNEAQLDRDISIWFNALKQDNNQNEIQYINSLSHQERQDFYLNIR